MEKQDKEILEGNFLISKFMGWTYPDLKTFERDMAFHESHHYDKRWDKLMPVIEKISACSPDHEWDINIGKTFCSVYMRDLDDGRYLYGVYGSDDKPLPAFYQAVIQYIQWFNYHQK